MQSDAPLLDDLPLAVAVVTHDSGFLPFAFTFPALSTVPLTLFALPVEHLSNKPAVEVEEQRLSAASTLSQLSTMGTLRGAGIAKKSSSPREHVPTEDRVDNNLDKVLKTMGYARNNSHSRKMNFKAALMVGFLHQITRSALAHEDQQFLDAHYVVMTKMSHVVHAYAHNAHRITSPPNFKLALKLLASDEGTCFLRRALCNSA